MENVYLIRSNEDGKWWDSAKRIILEVKKGDVVGFANLEDAEHFVKQDRAVPLTEAEIAAVQDGEELDDVEGAPEVPDSVDDVIENPATKSPKPRSKSKRSRK